MPLSRFVSDYGLLTVDMSTGPGTPLASMIDKLNQYPVGSLRRYEMESALYHLLSNFMDDKAQEIKTGLRYRHLGDDLCDNG